MTSRLILGALFVAYVSAAPVSSTCTVIDRFTNGVVDTESTTATSGIICDDLEPTAAVQIGWATTKLTLDIGPRTIDYEIGVAYYVRRVNVSSDYINRITALSTAEIRKTLVVTGGTGFGYLAFSGGGSLADTGFPQSLTLNATMRCYTHCPVGTMMMPFEFGVPFEFFVSYDLHVVNQWIGIFDSQALESTSVRLFDIQNANRESLPNAVISDLSAPPTQPTEAPEPASVALMAAGLVVAYVGRQRIVVK